MFLYVTIGSMLFVVFLRSLMFVLFTSAYVSEEYTSEEKLCYKSVDARMSIHHFHCSLIAVVNCINLVWNRA